MLTAHMPGLEKDFFKLAGVSVDLPKELESTVKIRFQDCDPYGHLNNGAYINLFINAREDQLESHYNFDIYEYSKVSGAGFASGLRKSRRNPCISGPIDRAFARDLRFGCLSATRPFRAPRFKLPTATGLFDSALD